MMSWSTKVSLCVAVVSVLIVCTSAVKDPVKAATKKGTKGLPVDGYVNSMDKGKDLSARQFGLFGLGGYGLGGFGGYGLGGYGLGGYGLGYGGIGLGYGGLGYGGLFWDEDAQKIVGSNKGRFDRKRWNTKPSNLRGESTEQNNVQDQEDNTAYSTADQDSNIAYPIQVNQQEEPRKVILVIRDADLDQNDV